MAANPNWSEMMHRSLRVLLLAGAAGLCACERTPVDTTAAEVVARSAPEGVASPGSASGIANLPPAVGCDRFAALGVDATFVLYTPGDSRYVVCNLQRARQRLLPASTFKIANALIGLETGAVRDEHEVMKWDGLKRGVPAWNQDTDLASGMRNSTVWFYQAMARRIGEARMREWVRKLGYGNGDIGPDDDIDHFWLDGALRITAFEEIEFIDRLRRHALPLSERSQSIVIRILERDRGILRHAHDGRGDWVLRAKPGAALAIDHKTGDLMQGADAARALHGAEPVGWFVGWIDRGGKDDVVFAFNMKLRNNADLPLREQLTRELLVANGVLPAP